MNDSNDTHSGDKRKTDQDSPASQQPPRRTASQVAREILSLTENLQRSRRLETTLNSVTQIANRLTHSYQSSLRLLDDSGKRLLTSARTGPSVHRRGATPFLVREGVIGWVATQCQPAVINQVESDQRYVRRQGQIWTPSGIIAVPLMSRDHCIGVLSAARRAGKKYTRADLDLLKLTAQVSAPYLEIARLKRLNESDPLTLLHNRRHLQERLPQEMARARRTGQPLTVAMLDIDHFKQVNDRFGHQVGDVVLVEMAERIQRFSRISDVIVRWGGEEFFLIFPNTCTEDARQIAERIRQHAHHNPFGEPARTMALTISLGVAELAPDDQPSDLEQRADQALYQAKRLGRNRVETAAPDHLPPGQGD